MISMPVVQDIRKLARSGCSVAEISRETGASEPTVRKYIRKDDFSPKVPVRKSAPSKLDPHKPTIDRLHVMQLFSRATDKVRCAERRESDERREMLKGTKYVWLKREENLTERQAETRRALAPNRSHLRTARACQMTEAMRDVYSCAGAGEAGPALDRLLSWMMHSNVPEMKRVARTVRENREGILNYFGSRLTNAYLEGANSLIQSIKKAARGFRNVDYFTAAIFLRLGGLSFDALSCAKA